MKLAVIAFFISAFAYAAPKTVETGLYSATDLETGDIQATLLIRQDKTINFKVKTSDFEMPEPGCEGTYVVEEANFIAQLECPLDFLSEVNVTIDITDVTPESVRSAEGVNVNVTIDALSEDPFKFNLKKVQ